MTTDNHKAITAFYTQHRTTVIDWARKRGMDTDEAQDLVQDVFVRLLRTDKMISEVTLPALAYQTFTRLFLDRWRHRRCVERHELYLMRQQSWTDGHAVVSAHETMNMFEQGMARLDESACRILRMNIEEGKKVSEIADCLQLKYKTAENKLYFARKELRQYMRKAMSC